LGRQVLGRELEAGRRLVAGQPVDPALNGPPLAAEELVHPVEIAVAGEDAALAVDVPHLGRLPVLVPAKPRLVAEGVEDEPDLILLAGLGPVLVRFAGLFGHDDPSIGYP